MKCWPETDSSCQNISAVFIDTAMQSRFHRYEAGNGTFPALRCAMNSMASGPIMSTYPR